MANDADVIDLMNKNTKLLEIIKRQMEALTWQSMEACKHNSSEDYVMNSDLRQLAIETLDYDWDFENLGQAFELEERINFVMELIREWRIVQ